MNEPPDAPLAIADLRDAIATRAVRRLRDPVIPFEFGVFDSQGEPVDFARLRREWPRNKTVNPTGSIGPVEDRRAGTFVYGGIMIGQYGHFLLESLARAWFWQNRAADGVVFHCERPELRPWQADAFRMCGLDTTNIVFVTRCTLFERLLVPQPGYVISTLFHPDHRDTLAFEPWMPVPGRKLWISRSRLGDEALGTFTNEVALESLLGERGWTIVHPQILSFAEQIRLFASAEVIGGIEGSALHSIVHVGNFGGTLRIVPRTPAQRLNSRNYELIARAKGLRQQVFGGRIEQISGQGASGRLAIDDIDDCARFLDEA